MLWQSKKAFWTTFWARWAKPAATRWATRPRGLFSGGETSGGGQGDIVGGLLENGGSLLYGIGDAVSDLTGPWRRQRQSLLNGQSHGRQKSSASGKKAVSTSSRAKSGVKAKAEGAKVRAKAKTGGTSKASSGKKKTTP